MKGKISLINFSGILLGSSKIPPGIVRLQNLRGLGRMKHFRISVRLYALVGLALLTMAAVMTLGLFQEQDKLVAQRKAMLEAMNENAVTVFNAYYKQEQAGTLSKADAQARAIEAIQAMRYQDSGYFCSSPSWQSLMIVHPIKPALNGKSARRRTRTRPASTIFVAVCQEGGCRKARRFVDYCWPKPGAEEPALKYSRMWPALRPWGWIVGASGASMHDDLNGGGDRLARA